MAKTYVLHPGGADTNGGGYTANYSGSWDQWHSSFGPIDIANDATITNNGSGKVRLTKSSAFDGAMVGMLAYCDFSDTYTDGRYEILAVDASNNYIDIDLAYDSNVPTANVTVGGAILTPKAAVAAAYAPTANGDILLVPCNQTSQTINEVDGSGDAMVCITAAYKLDIRGVNETTGALLGYRDVWPVIRAKTGSTWAANTSMLYMQSTAGSNATSYLNLDKIILDGNALTPRVVRLGDNASDYVVCLWGDVKITNPASTGYAIYQYGYTNGFARTIHIDGGGTGGTGYYNYGNRPLIAVAKYLWINDFAVAGLNIGDGNAATVLNTMHGPIILSNCTTGLISDRYNVYWNKVTFVNNVIDIRLNKYDTETRICRFYNCLFYNDNASGKIIGSNDDGTYVSVEMYNCALGVANGADVCSAFVINDIDCVSLSGDPFVDKSSDDYRLDPAGDDFASIYNWDTGLFAGALGPSEPDSAPSNPFDPGIFH